MPAMGCSRSTDAMMTRLNSTIIISSLNLRKVGDTSILYTCSWFNPIWPTDNKIVLPLYSIPSYPPFLVSVVKERILRQPVKKFLAYSNKWKPITSAHNKLLIISVLY
jgi:hypothetical protein